MSIKVDEKPIKEAEKGKSFNYDRLKRLSQPTGIQQGQIKYI